VTATGFDWSAIVDPVQRNGHNQPLVYPYVGADKKVAYKRVTTYIGSIDDSNGLSKWSQRKLAYGLALRHDYYTGITALDLDTNDDPDRNKQLDELIELAKQAAAADSFSTVGSALHRFTERADKNLDIDNIPLEYAPDLAAYTKATEPLKMKWVEPFTVNDVLQVAGTPDRIFTYQGGTYIGDVKTGHIDGRGIGKIAMQLAVYSRSALYNHDSGERTTHGASTERGLIIHLPAGQGTCDLHWVDLRAGWHGVMLSKAVHTYRAQRFQHLTVPGLASVDTPFDSKQPPEPQRVPIDNLLSAVQGADDRATLDNLWRLHHAQFKEIHIEAAKARAAILRATQVPVDQPVDR
jgi:hypothetical protein